MDDDDLTPDPALAAAMGFSAFGASAAADGSKKKKRKFDAVVAMPSAPPSSSSGTGANRIPVGTRSALDGSSDQGGVPAVAATNAEHAASTTTMMTPRSAMETMGNTETLDDAPSGHRLRSDKLPDGEWDFAALRKGVPMPNGDIAYYDPRFVQDPWEHLVDDEEAAGG